MLQPIDFKWIYPGAKQSAITVKGYDADLLIDVCNAILAAHAAGDLRKQQESLAKQAAIVVGASAKAGIQGLVYALAGYDRTKEEVIAALARSALHPALDARLRLMLTTAATAGDAAHPERDRSPAEASASRGTPYQWALRERVAPTPPEAGADHR